MNWTPTLEKRTWELYLNKVLCVKQAGRQLESQLSQCFMVKTLYSAYFIILFCPKETQNVLWLLGKWARTLLRVWAWVFSFWTCCGYHEIMVLKELLRRGNGIPAVLHCFIILLAIKVFLLEAGWEKEEQEKLICGLKGNVCIWAAPLVLKKIWWILNNWYELIIKFSRFKSLN